MTPSWKPCCPNHGEPLEGCGFPLPSKGTGKCPVSGYDFNFEADTSSTKMTVDKFGKPMKVTGWKIEGGAEEKL